MPVRQFMALLLGAAAILASPAMSKQAAPPPDRSAWPPTLRTAIEAADANCVNRHGKPGLSPDLVKIGVDILRPVYVLDLNAYECLDAKPTDGPAAITIYSGASRIRTFPVPPPGDVVQSFTVTAYASRVDNNNLSISETPDCGRPDAANILHRRWAWCSRSVSNNVFGDYSVLPARPLWVPGESAWSVGNYVEAVRLWTAAADQGDATSMVDLAAMYSVGKTGVPQDEARAVALYHLAAETPAAKPAPQLGFNAMANNPYNPPDPDNAANMLAMLQLALAYEEGHGVKPDEAQAAVWFRRWATSTVNPALRVQRLKTLAEYHIQP